MSSQNLYCKIKIMKNFLLILLFVIPMSGFSQPKIGPDNVITSPNNPGSGVIDGVYRKSDIISKRRPVPYEHVRESDYVWGKRTWSYIDLREKINHSLYFPTEKYLTSASKGATNELQASAQGRFSLYYILTKSMQDKSITAFYADRAKTTDLNTGDEVAAIVGGDSFKYPLDPNDIDFDTKLQNMIGKQTFDKDDPIFDPNSNLPCYISNNAPQKIKDAVIANSGAYQFTIMEGENMDERAYNEHQANLTTDENLAFTYDYGGMQPDPVAAKFRIKIKKFFKPEEITKWYLKEDWFFDKETSKFKVRIIGIAPVVMDEVEEKVEVIINGVPVIKDIKTEAERPLFWLYFPHVRQVLKNFYCYNPKTDAQWMSYDDLFWKRKFNAVVYKESSLFDRKIEEYRFGRDALYESKRIKDEMRDFEHDVWNF